MIHPIIINSLGITANTNSATRAMFAQFMAGFSWTQIIQDIIEKNTYGKI